MLLCLERGKIGEIYHITGPRPVTFRELAETIANVLKVPPPRLSIPRNIAVAGATLFEVVAKAVRVNPPLSRTGAAFFSEDRRFSWAKAQQELGYTPQFDIQRGIENAVDWYRQNGLL
jgi:dihydroflavonol-4-reductase